ncbi:MAG: PilZ domain-containing protein [Acidimicrobiales bacterium]
MTPGATPVDRLLPRHDTSSGFELAWNIHEERTGFRKSQEVSARGVIRDLSLEGALVEVPESQHHEPGDRVVVRFRGHEARAQIRHRIPGSRGHVMYGVRFIGDHDFNQALIGVVGACGQPRARHRLEPGELTTPPAAALDLRLRRRTRRGPGPRRCDGRCDRQHAALLLGDQCRLVDGRPTDEAVPEPVDQLGPAHRAPVERSEPHRASPRDRG